jgi:hypothetical protein
MTAAATAADNDDDTAATTAGDDDNAAAAGGKGLRWAPQTMQPASSGCLVCFFFTPLLLRFFTNEYFIIGTLMAGPSRFKCGKVSVFIFFITTMAVPSRFKCGKAF